MRFHMNTSTKFRNSDKKILLFSIRSIIYGWMYVCERSQWLIWILWYIVIWLEIITIEIDSSKWVLNHGISPNESIFQQIREIDYVQTHFDKVLWLRLRLWVKWNEFKFSYLNKLFEHFKLNANLCTCSSSSTPNQPYHWKFQFEIKWIWLFRINFWT